MSRVMVQTQCNSAVAGTKTPFLCCCLPVVDDVEGRVGVLVDQRRSERIKTRGGLQNVEFVFLGVDPHEILSEKLQVK